MDKLKEQKNLMREAVLKRRNSLSEGEIKEFSIRIANKLMDLEPVLKAKSMMGFASIRNEVDLSFLLEKEKKKGKTILLPRVEENVNIEAVEFRGWEHTIPGSFGISEPLGPIFSPEKIDVILVPGLVFDPNGYRLGYGKGYYDRFLRRLGKKTFLCGVCYEFQVVENVFPHEADVPVDWIVTEKSEILINGDFF